MRVPSLSTARFAALVALVLLLFSTGIVVGAAGAPLILGQLNGSGSSTTTVRSTNSNVTLKVDNTGSGRALEVTDDEAVPLRVVAPSGKPPFTVNSGTKVNKLNADRVDGKSANGIVRAAFQQELSSVVIGGSAATVVSTTLTLPGPGYVLVSGSATPYTFDSDCGCEVAFAVSDGSTTSLYQRAQIGTNANATAIANVQVQYLFSYSSGGTKTFDLRALNFQTGLGDANLTYRSISALFVPFGSGGSSPSGAPALMAPQVLAPSGE